MGQWSDLPVDILELIEDRVVLYADKLRIRAVCKLWHLQLPKINCDEFPWLLQAVDDNVEASHTLFNPIDKKYYYLDVPNVLKGKICKGSSHGWVITVEDTYNKSYNTRSSNRIYLVNPLTSVRIELPSRDMFPDIHKYNPDQVDAEYSVYMFENRPSFFPSSTQQVNDRFTGKFVMSRDPSTRDGKDCVIATIYGEYDDLACCTLRSKRWNPVPIKEEHGIEDGRFEDILFHAGKLHALVKCGRLSQVLVFEKINRVKPNPRITLIASFTGGILNGAHDSQDPFIVTEEYLVENSDRSRLMMVERYISVTSTPEKIEISHTIYFKVYTIDTINRSMAEVNSIGEDAIILGMNTPISISSQNSIGYKGNQIYFTDSKCNYNPKESKLNDTEIGVFNLEDGTVQPLCGLESSPTRLWPPPIWLSMARHQCL